MGVVSRVFKELRKTPAAGHSVSASRDPFTIQNWCIEQPRFGFTGGQNEDARPAKYRRHSFLGARKSNLETEKADLNPGLNPNSSVGVRGMH